MGIMQTNTPKPATAEIRVNTKIHPHPKVANTNKMGFNTNNTPNAVAMPLPPLKLYHTGNICPTTAAKAIKLNQVIDSSKLLATNTQGNAFRASTKNVINAGNFAKGPTIPACWEALTTLVAPGLFDPI